MAQERSFFCERTAEFVLSYQIASILQEVADRVLPIHFWLNREGRRETSDDFPGESIRVVGVYARRPKVSRIGDARLRVKFNEQLFEAASSHGRVGIPMLSGVPVVPRLGELGINSHSCWFEVKPDCQVRDREIWIEKPGNVISTEDFPGDGAIVGPLNSTDILETVTRHAEAGTWQDAQQRIREAKNSLDEINRFPGRLFGYKPFYCLLINSNA
ncbi:hypothetical protein [Bremerella sp.]|uniref:hypothetical protein n=1 Tax=Bremerella sp. TaxID=2795602 RepID=UPI00391BDF98